MANLRTLKHAVVVEKEKGSLLIEADCIVNGKEEKSFRFWVPTEQTEMHGPQIWMQREFLDDCERGIVEWAAKHGNHYSSVDIMILDDADRYESERLKG